MPDVRSQIVLTMFKPVPGGYVFREPYRWTFADAPHYFVNEAQKDEIAAITIPRRQILLQLVLWASLCLMVAVAGLIVWLCTRHEDPTAINVAMMAALTAVQAIAALLILRWWKLRRLRPLLARLPVTDMRITRDDLRKAVQANARAVSAKQLALLVAINIMSSAVILVSSIVMLKLGHASGYVYLALALLFGGLAIVQLRRLKARMAQETVGR